MGFGEAWGGAIARGGMDEGTYQRYKKKSDSELVALARNRDLYALKMLKLRKKDDDEIQRMLKRGY